MWSTVSWARGSGKPTTWGRMRVKTWAIAALSVILGACADPTPITGTATGKPFLMNEEGGVRELHHGGTVARA